MNRNFKIILLSILTISLIIAIFCINNVLAKSDIYNGTKIANINVGSLSKDDAKDMLKSKLDEELESREITAIGSEYTEKITYKQLGVKYNYDKAIKEAYKIGRTGNIFARLKDIYRVTFYGKNIKLEVSKDKEKIRQVVENIDGKISIDKKDATIKLVNGSFIFTDEVVGKYLDKKKLEDEIYAVIDNGESVKIPIETDKPKATKELLSQVKEEIGTYTTKFSNNDLNRNYNIQRSANSISDVVVLPEETFSFNLATGPRSLKAGYKEATVIVDGEFVPGEGGGVCQVSSTLYNTMLDSGIKVTERHTHSKPISYVPPGKDATVAYELLDLKFKNNYKSPVYIKSFVGENSLTIKLYGNKNSKPGK